ncbi:MAG: hypothetical protein SOX53_03750 [Candidatus Onthovivens sp.]|nr:hypothetical protein [Candidatus Onthovivens sp.]
MKKIIRRNYIINENSFCDNDCNNCPLQGFEFCDNIMVGYPILRVIDDVKKANDFIKNLEIEEVEYE